MKRPKFSVVIPLMEQAGHHKNRQGNIEALLDCIDHQTYTDYEIVLVEQYEEAPFYDYLEDRVHIYQPIKGMPFRVSWCRNVGAKQANGESLFFIDADMVFGIDYFQIASRRITRSTDFKFTKAFARVIMLNERGRKDYLQNGYRKTWDACYVRKVVSNKAACGYATLFDRDFFLKKIGGFLENYHTHGGQEKSLFYRAGHQAGRMSPPVDYSLVHLYHFWTRTASGIMYRPKVKRIDENFGKANTLRGYIKSHLTEVTQAILAAGIGNLDHPTIVPLRKPDNG